MNTKALIPQASKEISRVDKQLRVANKALVRIEGDRYAELFGRHPEILGRICWYYPFSEEMIERFVNLIAWHSLSRNESLPWSEALIAKYEDRWNWAGWNGLSGNKSLPWSEVLIEKFEDRWDWSSFYGIDALVKSLSPSTIVAILERIEQNRLSVNLSLE